jgi:hypothetical protein
MTDRRREEKSHINCFSCESFYITYDKKYPYGCRIIGFKSIRMPSADVYANSDMECGLFRQKEKKQKE